MAVLIPQPGFGARLKEARQELGLTQVELAKQTNISRVTAVAYEAETSSPDLSYLIELHRAGLDVAYIVFNQSEAEIGRQGAERWREASAIVDAMGLNKKMSEQERLDMVERVYKVLGSSSTAAESPVEAT